ncbi:MAG: hypothetical protein ACE5FL_01045, partial [Myxococcota bacterium]
MDDPVAALVWYVAFLLSTTLHEASHALAAMLGGDPTAYEGGQVSIDPLPHIRREPVGMVLLPAISLLMIGWPFGFASAPYNPGWAEGHARRAAWMGGAGARGHRLTPGHAPAGSCRLRAQPVQRGGEVRRIGAGYVKVIHLDAGGVQHLSRQRCCHRGRIAAVKT